MSIYKAYDIRGTYPDQLNEDLAYAIGRGFAELLTTEDSGRHLTVAVGRDMRVSGTSLTARVIDGIRDGGVSVVSIGLVSTPTFYFAVAHYGYDGGLMVSASHNPKEYNGFKMTRAKAVPIGGDTGIDTIKEWVDAGSLKSASNRGSFSEREGILEDQVAHDLSYADAKRIKPFTVVADAANAMGSLYLTELFKHLPCRLITMNFDLDGTFPAHEADPFKEENVADLQKRVVDEKADIGIATDGDGDRIFFIDNSGRTVDPALIRGIMARIFLRERPGAKIAYDIRPGRITKDMIEESGGIPIVTRVGHSLIKAKAIAEGAYFAGESSGHFFLNMDKEGCYEVPMIVALKLLQELSDVNRSFVDYIGPLQRYSHSGEINTKVSDVMAVLDAIKQKYSDGTLSTLDGVTVEYPDYWFNVRGSNTEPLIRLNLEAHAQDVMEQKRDEVLALIRSFAISR